MNGLLQNSSKFLKRNTSTILTVLGATGVIVTTVLTVKATRKATKVLNEAENQKGEELTKLEIIEYSVPIYIPTVLIGASTILCIFGANAFNKRTQASLISAYSLVNSSYNEYKSKLKELYGEEAHENIVNSIVIEKAEDVTMYSECLLANCSLSSDDTSNKKLFYEEYSQRYFEATIEQVISAEYHLNRNYVLGGLISLNDFFEFLGLERTDYGESVGWSCYSCIYWLDFNHRKILLNDGRECYVIEMVFSPESGYEDED